MILFRNEFERLTGLAKAAELPPLPAQDADGNYPAVEYARASLARKNAIESEATSRATSRTGESCAPE